MIRDTVLALLSEICDTKEVARNPDVELFEAGLLDSFGTVQLLVFIYEHLNIDVAPTEITREMWTTPNKIIAYLEERSNS